MYIIRPVKDSDNIQFCTFIVTKSLYRCAFTDAEGKNDPLAKQEDTNS